MVVDGETDGAATRLCPMTAKRSARYSSRQARRCTFPLDVLGRLPALMNTMEDTWRSCCSETA